MKPFNSNRESHNLSAQSEESKQLKKIEQMQWGNQNEKENKTEAILGNKISGAQPKKGFNKISVPDQSQSPEVLNSPQVKQEQESDNQVNYPQTLRAQNNALSFDSGLNAFNNNMYQRVSEPSFNNMNFDAMGGVSGGDWLRQTSTFNGQSVMPQNYSPENMEIMINSLFQIINSQSKSLQNLYDKVNKMTQKVNEFALKTRELIKRNEKKQQKKPPLSNEANSSQNDKDRLQMERFDPQGVVEHKNGHLIQDNGMGQKNNQSLLNTPLQSTISADRMNSETLLKILFGQNKVYDYKLQLNLPLQMPLYRERNFSLSIKLTDLEGKIVKNRNKIPLSLAIYSSQNPPKFIEKNTAGQKILKGYIEQSLHFGNCQFEKIQIKEVTSHFRNGWVFIVIIPCMTPLGNATNSQDFVNYLSIEPLVLEKVIVKAKKLKDSSKKSTNAKQEAMNDDRDILNTLKEQENSNNFEKKESIYHEEKGEEAESD